MERLPPREWDEDAGRALTAKQWDALRQWFSDNRQQFVGKSSLRILFEKRPTNFPRCPIKTLDQNMVIEACKLANVQLVDFMRLEDMNDSQRAQYEKMRDGGSSQ